MSRDEGFYHYPTANDDIFIRTVNKYQHMDDRDTRLMSIGSRIGSSTAGIPDDAFGVLQNATILQPASEMQMELVSDDAGDTQTIRIDYFNEAWEFKTEDVILTGLTAIDTDTEDIYRIDNMYIIKGSPAIGDITIKDTGAVALYGQINPLTTFMERAIHYVKRGYKCVVTDIIVGTLTKEGIIFRLFRSKQYGTDLVPSGVYSVSLQGTNMNHAFNVSMTCQNPDGLRMAVGIGVYGLAAVQGATASFRYYEEVI